MGRSASLYICFFFLFCCIYTVFNLGKFKKHDVIAWDRAGYYLYLPALLIYDDLDELHFISHIDSTYELTQNNSKYGLVQIEQTGHLVNRYSYGVALFELSGFLIAHTYASYSQKYPPDGYSIPYQLAIQFTSILFSFLGLVVLRRFLRDFGIKETLISCAIILLAFGTNFYYYSAFEHGMSHNFSFFLCSTILFLTNRAYKFEDWKYFIFLGISLGWAALVRPVDIFFCIIPCLWLGFNMAQLRFLKRHVVKILVLMLCFLLPWIPQIVYWKLTTGQFLYYSYSEYGFDFTNPQVWKGLFSYRKGWFVYTPIAFIGFLYIFVAWRKKEYRNYAIAILLFYIPYIYVVFSWFQWYYGGSFGSRVMINTLPLLAIPLAIFVKDVINLSKIKKYLIIAVVCFLVVLNLFQSWQYNRGVLHWDAMSKEYYWRIFLKEHASEEDRSLLMGR